MATTGSATVRARSSGGALADLADFGRRLWVKGGEDDVLFLAGGVAFNILLAGVPFFLLLASGLGYVLGKSQAASNTAVIDFITDLFPDTWSGKGSVLDPVVKDIVRTRGTVGTFGLAWLVARGGFVRVMATTFTIAAISIAFIGQPGLSLGLIFAVVFVAGWCVVGSQPGLNALSGAYYPTAVRSTGVGAGLGVGRIGAIVGPIIGGQFMAAHWSTRDMFLAAAIPAAISAVAMFSLRWVVPVSLGATRKPAA